MLEDIAEGFKVGIAPSNDGVAQLESWDVGLGRLVSHGAFQCMVVALIVEQKRVIDTCLANNFIVSVHLPSESCETKGSEGAATGVIEDRTVRLRILDFNFQETFWNAVHFFDLRLNVLAFLQFSGQSKALRMLSGS